MMASMSAREYKEWEAYERATGPIDSMYDREILAQIHEVIQVNNQLTGASITKKGKKNPAGKFRKVRRPDEIFLPEGWEEEEPDEDDDEFEDNEEEDLYGESPDPYDEDEDELTVEIDPNAYDPSRDPFLDM